MSTPSTPNPRRLAPSGRIEEPVPPLEDRVIGLFSLEGASDAMAVNDFDQEEFVTNLIAKMRDGDPLVSLAASRQFLQYTKDLVTLSGRITSQSAVTQESVNGRQVSLTHQRTVLQPRPASFSSGAFHAPASVPAPAGVPVRGTESGPVQPD